MSATDARPKRTTVYLSPVLDEEKQRAKRGRGFGFWMQDHFSPGYLALELADADRLNGLRADVGHRWQGAGGEGGGDELRRGRPPRPRRSKSGGRNSSHDQH